ncbi:MAG: APC family permease [Xanthomonadales bacterium]|nr:APC family permease [Xanthomonadales bacterium]
MGHDHKPEPHLSRQLGLLGLTATGICAMFGASIYVVPFMIQRSVPGIGEYVLPAFLFAALPALAAAMAYGILASAMPRAGGSYIYASRGLSPYLGFIASFSQWFGLSIVIGVIAYVIVPFLRDIALGLQWVMLAGWLENGAVRVSLALAMIWLFVGINIRGVKAYERTLLPMMFLMFALGSIVIVAGFLFDHADFAAALQAAEGRAPPTAEAGAFDWVVFLSAAAIMFSSFIGFDSIAQAGGEARNPSRNLPLAIGLAIVTVGGFYFLFASAVYHAVPWPFVAEEALARDVSAPGMMAYLLPAGLSVAILAGAAIALINDLPAMLLAVSRLMFAWAEDGIFPAGIARVHPRFHTPHLALAASGVIASIGVLGSHFAGDFFLGIDIMVTAMMVNFLLMCVTLVCIRRVNPDMAGRIAVFKSTRLQALLGWTGALLLCGFLVVHVWKDMSSDVSAWYFHSTLVWLLVMAMGSVVFLVKFASLKGRGVDTVQLFKSLPE